MPGIFGADATGHHGVGNLFDPPPPGLAGESLGRDQDFRIELDPARVELIDLGLDPDAVQVGDRDDPCRDLDGLPGVGVPRGDDAVDRGDDPGLGEQRPGPVALGRRRGTSRPGRVQAAAIDVEVLNRPGPAGDQRLVAADLAVEEADVGLGFCDPRVRLGEERLQVVGVELGDDVSLRTTDFSRTSRRTIRPAASVPTTTSAPG